MTGVLFGSSLSTEPRLLSSRRAAADGEQRLGGVPGHHRGNGSLGRGGVHGAVSAGGQVLRGAQQNRTRTPRGQNRPRSGSDYTRLTQDLVLVFTGLSSLSDVCVGSNLDLVWLRFIVSSWTGWTQDRTWANMGVFQCVSPVAVLGPTRWF